jgi:diguanylate cyclase (GGDEF)-like protein
MVEDVARSGYDFPRTRLPVDDDLAQAGDDRDRSAEARDRAAERRDWASGRRDASADARDMYAEPRAPFDASLNAGAAPERIVARDDRRESAINRSQAAEDRRAASLDRIAAAHDRAASSIDQRTGAYRRDAGMVELERETARANRTGQPFVLAFIDVDGLKATNDTLGHAAGDLLLRRVVETLRMHLRSYDLIVRFGGDEFVCALLALDVDRADERFSLIRATLAVEAHASISVGLAAYRLHDSLETLLARADQKLLAERQQRPARAHGS